MTVRLYEAVLRQTSAALIALAVFSAIPVFAQDAPEAETPVEEASEPDPVEVALDLFEEAELAYREGRYEDAVALLTRARGLHREPVLLYNLGRAYESLGRHEEALDAYRGYLEEDPDANDREVIRTRIENLTERLNRREEDPPPPPPVVADSEGPSLVPFLVAGVGAVGLGAGVLFGFLSQSARSDAGEAQAHLDARESFREAETFATAANVSFIAGGALTVAGALWLLLDVLSADSSAGAVGLRPTPSGARLFVGFP